MVGPNSSELSPVGISKEVVATPPPTELSEDDKLAAAVYEQVLKAFPEYEEADLSVYDSRRLEDQSAWDSHGKNLIFFAKPQTGTVEYVATRPAPKIEVIFRPEGFAINYSNSSEPAQPYSIRNPSNSVFGPKERSWTTASLDFALEKAKIHMQGVDLQDPAFRNQPAGWFEGASLTFGDRLDAAEKYKATKKDSEKLQQQSLHDAAMVEVWDYVEHTPEVARNIATLSAGKHQTYMLAGKEYPVAEIVEEIQEGTELGQDAMLQELYKIEAYEQLLYDHGKLSKLRKPPKPKNKKR